MPQDTEDIETDTHDLKRPRKRRKPVYSRPPLHHTPRYTPQDQKRTSRANRKIPTAVLLDYQNIDRRIKETKKQVEGQCVDERMKDAEEKGFPIKQKAKPLGFDVRSYIRTLRKAIGAGYSVRRENVHIFLHANLWENLNVKTQRALLNIGKVHTPTKTRHWIETERIDEYGNTIIGRIPAPGDPVDEKMKEVARSCVQDRRIGMIVIGSNDRGFDVLAPVARQLGKRYHDYRLS